MNHKVWLLVVMYAGLVGCMDIRAVDKNKKSEDAAAAPTRLQAVSTGTWNRFRVLVPGGVSPAAIQKSRIREDKSLDRPQLVRSFSGGRFADDDVVAGETYVYEWNDINGVSFREKIVIPQDVALEGEIDFSTEVGAKLAAIESFGTLIFKDETLVTTQGRNWAVRAEHLVFGKGSRVRTFAPEQRAPQGSDGRNGGTILFAANFSEGEIHFDLRGENGGPGLDGPAPDVSLKGRDGENGRRPSGFNNGYYMQGTYMEYRCHGDGRMLAMPTPGHTGSPGFRGLKGRNGGDTALLTLSLGVSSVRYDLDSRDPGLRGEGGQGGEGGVGGKGGQGFVAARDIPHMVTMNCELTPDAPNGARGPKGERGEPGFPGSVRPVCIQQTGRPTDCY